MLLKGNVYAQLQALCYCLSLSPLRFKILYLFTLNPHFKHKYIPGARPFKCPVCGKTFTRSTNLNKHARVHSGRRPYPCEHCDKMFSSRGDLVRHAVIHTGEKPYACLICSLAFNRKVTAQQVICFDFYKFVLNIC